LCELLLPTKELSHSRSSYVTLARSHTCIYIHAHTGDAEVISIDAFVKEPKGLIFGVTLVKVFPNLW